MSAAAAWIADAAAWPVAFAQVREDPLLDMEIVERIGGGARAAMVASGGCTVAALVSRANIAALHCVDPNPAQLALSRLKLQLLETTTPAERLRLLGHAAMEQQARADQLAGRLGELGLDRNSLGPLNAVAELGPDYAARYERLFAALRSELTDFALPLKQLLTLDDPAEQARRVAPGTPLGEALDTAFGRTMALPNLVALFGEGATRNPREPFALHFLTRLRAILGTLPAAGNPFLTQLLLGRFTPRTEYFWLRQPALRPNASVSWEASPMVPALRQRRGEFDLVHLSNILDWLSPEEARETLECAHAALRPSGWVIVRQLNSVLDIHRLGSGFDWDDRTGAAMLARDRSFFYRAICVGQRR